MSSNEHNTWASPAPAGLVALAIACFCFYALLAGKVDHSCIPCWVYGYWEVSLYKLLLA